MTLSVDTNFLIDVLRRRDPEARRAFRRALASGEPMVASVIVHHELQYGAALHRNPASERENIRKVTGQLTIELLDLRDMTTAAEIRADLRRRGVSIGAYDLLIGGQALARGWRMVTNNIREFGRIPGLTVVDWRSFAT